MKHSALGYLLKMKSSKENSVQKSKKGNKKRLKPNSLFEQIVQHHLALDHFRVFALGDALGCDHREPWSMTKPCLLFGRNLPKNTSISPKKRNFGRNLLKIEQISPKSAVHTVMITTSGLTHNAYTGEIQNEVDLNEMLIEAFKELNGFSVSTLIKESQHPKR